MTRNLINAHVRVQRDHSVPGAGLSRARCLSLLFACP